MTEEETPTPIAAATVIGSAKAAAPCQAPIGAATTAAISIERASPSKPLTSVLVATRCPSTM